MSRFRVVITDFLDDDLATEKAALNDVADVVACNAAHENDLIGSIENADAIMLYHNITLSSRIIDRLTQCKLIVRCGVGYDNIDHVCARSRGIPVANVPDYGTEEVADSAIGLMLSLCRGIALANTRLRDSGRPWSYSLVAPLDRLRGRTFGIVGLGRIGTAVAIRAKSHGLRILYYDPYATDGLDKALGLERVETLKTLLERSDIVSLHCPLTAETRQIINSESLGWMKPGSYLVNTARGDVVDLTAIPKAIATGHLAGAGIDVFPQEPPPDDHPLLQAWRDPNHLAYDRVIINPHSAFYSEQGLQDIRIKSAAACRRALLGQALRNIVN